MEKVYRIGNDRKRLHSVLSMLSNFLLKPDADIEIVVRDTVYKRSTEQNRLYWACLNEIAEQAKPEGREYSAETWAEYFKSRFIGSEDITLPNGQTLTRPISTTTLDKGSFSEYVTQIQAWCGQHGILLDLDAIAA